MTEIAQNWSMAMEARASNAGKRNSHWPRMAALYAPGRRVADRMRTAGAGDGAMSGLELARDGEACPGLTRGMDFSDVRLEEIVRLRVAIASGSYKVSAADLADKLLDSVTGRGIEGRKKYD
jgi:hypothetical protein